VTVAHRWLRLARLIPAAVGWEVGLKNLDLVYQYAALTLATFCFGANHRPAHISRLDCRFRNQLGITIDNGSSNHGRFLFEAGGIGNYQVIFGNQYFEYARSGL
jgi:hypothetical protein